MRTLTMVVSVSFLFMLSNLLGQESPSTPFAELARDIEKDGDFLLYLKTDSFIKKVGTKSELVAKFLLQRDANQDAKRKANLDAAFRVISMAFNESGVRDLKYVAASSRETEGGLHRGRILFEHGGKSQGQAWKILGAQNHQLEGLSLLPQNTAAVVGMDLNLNLLWQWIMGLAQRAGAPQVVQPLMGMVTLASLQGVNVDKILGSVDSQMLLALTLDEQSILTVPLKGKMMKVPQPGFLVCVKAKDESIYQTIRTLIAKNQLPFRITRMRDKKNRLYSFASLGQSPLGLGIAFTHHKGWFIAGTSADLVKEAISLQDGKKSGIKADKEFQRLSVGLPTTGNGVFYLHPKVVRLLVSLLEDQLKREMGPAEVKLLKQFAGLEDDSLYVCAIAHRTKTGLEFRGNSNIPFNEVILGGTAMLGAIGAMMEDEAGKTPGGDAHEANVQNLKKLNIAIMLYTTDHKDAFPSKDGIAGLNQILAHQKDFPTSVLISPFDPRRKAGTGRLTAANSSYLYFGGGLKADDELAKVTPIAMDRPGFNNRGVTILFLNGHVSFLKGRFRKPTEVIRALAAEVELPKKRVELLMKKVSALK